MGSSQSRQGVARVRHVLVVGAAALGALIVCVAPAHAVTVVDGTTTCAAVGLGSQEFRIDAPVTGTYAIDAGNSLHFQYHPDSSSEFSFTNSTIRIGGVLVLAGGKTTVWDMGAGATGWPSLSGATDPDTGVPYPPDQVAFCFDYSLLLNPNVSAQHDQQWTWSIAKTGDVGELVLAEDQSYSAQYQVTVTPSGPVGAGLSASGQVFISNPTPSSTTIQSVGVSLGDVAATVTCPDGLPSTVAPFSTLTCVAMAALPDTSDRVVVVDLVHDGPQAVTQSVETLSFDASTTSYNDIDECVSVFDDKVSFANGFLGTACASQGPATFTYTALIGPFAACGAYAVVNTATIIGSDTGASGSSSSTVGVSVPCAPDPGCTLTAGYWKLHSEFGPSSYDDTWAHLTNGASTPFFQSGVNYIQALAASPRGNAYWILAQAYIAAQLNGLADADFTAAAGSFTPATDILQQYTPAQIGSLPAKSAARAQILDLATTLENYNKGVIGPGACTTN